MRKAATPRLETDPIARQKYDATAVTDKLVVERVAEIAANHGVPMAYIALTWLRHKNPVVAPIIGATKLSHLESAVESLTVQLTPDEITYREEPYTPHPIVGLIPYGSQLLWSRR